MNLGPTELLIVLGIILLLFGGAKLPKLARSLGQAKNEFEAGTRDTKKGELEDAASDAKPDATKP
jgi:sec-independent protein translocase protein TatA